MMLESDKRVRQKMIGLGEKGDGQRTGDDACLDLDPILIGIPKLGVGEVNRNRVGGSNAGSNSSVFRVRMVVLIGWVPDVDMELTYSS